MPTREVAPGAHRAGAVLAMALVAVAFPAHAERIAKVLDGDTVVTAAGERVRLMGFDTPELRGRCRREHELARRAQQELRRLAVRGLDLERHGRDRYGRTLAVARTPDGRDVAGALIGAGLAQPYAGRGPRGGWCTPGGWWNPSR